MLWCFLFNIEREDGRGTAEERNQENGSKKRESEVIKTKG